VLFNANASSTSSSGSKPSFQVNTSTSPVSFSATSRRSLEALEADQLSKKSATTSSPSVLVSENRPDNRRRPLEEEEEEVKEEKSAVDRDETDDGFVSPKFTFTMGSEGIKHFGTFSSSKPKEDGASSSSSTFETGRKRELSLSSDHVGGEVVRKKRTLRRIVEPGEEEDESNGPTLLIPALEDEAGMHLQTIEPATEEEEEYEVEKVITLLFLFLSFFPSYFFPLNLSFASTLTSISFSLHSLSLALHYLLDYGEGSG
jgi:hypothetical protein